jgi:orotate phosphoribosyltransferase
MNNIKLLEILLHLGAIHFTNSTPFQWASGWFSPIYCDNRLALSSYEARKFIASSMQEVLTRKFQGIECIVAVATGALPMGAIVAQELQLPFAYVRPKAKDHGLENLVEGKVEKGERVVVIEDLVSTGGSSLKAVEALRDKGADVLGMVAIFTYDFPQARQAMKEAEVDFEALVSYPMLLELLKQQGRISAAEEIRLSQWRESPETWGK